MQHTKKLLLVDPNSGTSRRPLAAENPTTKALDGLDVEIANTLNSDLPEDVKAKLYILTVRKYRAFDKNKVNSTAEKPAAYAESELLQYFPDAQRHLAKGIFSGLKDNPDVSFTEKGQLIYRQSVIPDSNAVELVKDVLKPKNANPPKGWVEFARALSDAKVSKNYIINTERWQTMHPELLTSYRRQKQKPLAPDIATPRDEPESVAKDRTRRAKTKSSIGKRWKEY